MKTGRAVRPWDAWGLAQTETRGVLRVRKGRVRSAGNLPTKISFIHLELYEQKLTKQKLKRSHSSSREPRLPLASLPIA